MREIWETKLFLSTEKFGQPNHPPAIGAYWVGMESIGAKLKSARLAVGLRQNEAAAAAGVSASHLSNVEKGKDRPSLSLLIKLAVLYKCDVAELARDDEELSQAEATTDADEILLLRAYRRMSPEQKSGVAALIGLRKIA